MEDTIFETIKHKIVACAERVYRHLGSGHSEIVYHKALEVELRYCNIKYSTKAPISLMYRGCIVGYSEVDIIIHVVYNKKPIDIVVELKATTYTPRSSEKAQLQSYIRALRADGGNRTSVAESRTCFCYKQGLLINFPQPTAKRVKNNIECIVVDIQDEIQKCDGGSETVQGTPVLEITL